MRAGAAGHNWSQFRGPDGLGVAQPNGGFPLQWDAKTGQNILWKIDVPAFGHSSPIVWQDRVFLTGQSGREGRLLCVACDNGRTLWDIPVMRAATDEFDPETGSGLCASTPATDGQGVYALFSTGDVVRVSFDGRVVWKQHLCDPVNSFGLSSSVVLWKETVILQLDQGNSQDDNLSVVLALDKATGKTRWTTKRPVPNSWSSPIIIRHEGRAELVTCANPFVISYDPDTGEELWRVKGLNGDIVPMPTYGQGLVFAANAGAGVLAIVPGGRGDVTATNVAWSKDEGLPSTASPVTDGVRLLLCEAGELTCYDARTGDVAWRATAGEGSWASPTLVGKNVYLPDKNGKTHVFELADRFKLLASSDVQDEITASPAFANGRIYLRTKRSLFCIRTK